MFRKKNIYICENVHTKGEMKEKSDSFQTKRNIIVVTVYFFIMNQIKFRLRHYEKENSHYDHIHFN